MFAQHAFAVYPLATLSAGAELIVVPARGLRFDHLAAMGAAIRPDTRIVWIVSHNPTGNFLPLLPGSAGLPMRPCPGRRGC